MRASVRELKNRLSDYLRSVRKGHAVTVTSYNKPIARLTPVPAAGGAGLSRLIEAGLVAWSGKKPRGGAAKERVRLKSRDGKTLSDLVLEDRR